MTHRISFPKQLFTNVSWAFGGAPVIDMRDFSDEVQQYQCKVGRANTWLPDQIVVVAPKLYVQFPDSHGDDSEFPSHEELVSDDGKNFSAVELLFKIHNIFVERYCDGDEQFLEGLTLVSKNKIPPVYLLNIGS